MKKLKYYVIDTLLNSVSIGFNEIYQAERDIKNIYEETFSFRLESLEDFKKRFLIIPKW